jgi:type IV pilus assembly protein PilM
MNILGIYIDSSSIQTAFLRKGRRGIEIRALRAFPLNADTNVKPLYIDEFKGRIATGLSAKDFLIRSLEIKVAGSRHIEEVAAFQSEALNHFKPEEVITIPFLGKKEKGKTEALLFTVLSDGLKKHLSQLEEFGIDPDAISTVPSALCHFIRWKFPKLTEAFIIDLGSSETTCALMEKGELKKSHSISIGIDNLLAAFHEDRKKILLKNEIEGSAKQSDLLLLKPGLNPRLSEELTELRQQMAKVYYSFTRGGSRPVLFTGRSDAFIHLREFLIDYSDREWLLTPEEQKFAISIGLAIEQTTTPSLQLRQGEFFPKKNWTRMGFYALALIGASTLLSAALLGFGYHSISLKKQQMLEALQTSSRRTLLAEGKVEEQIDQWISAIENNNKEYPYILQAPKAVEVLSWLSSHPLLEELKMDGDPIDMREIKYELSSFPTIHSEKEPFLAKVGIEFNFKSVMNARKFHEALRAGDDWVDGTKEISWDVLNNGYRAAFFMKNRGPHVP